MHVVRHINNCAVTDVFGDELLTGRILEGSDGEKTPEKATVEWFIRNIVRSIPAKDHLEAFIDHCVHIGAALQTPGHEERITLKQDTAEWLKKIVTEVGVFPSATVVEGFQRHLSYPGPYTTEEGVE